MTAKEYEYLEKRWQELYRQRREAQKRLDAINKEMQKVEKKLNQPLDK